MPAPKHPDSYGQFIHRLGSVMSTVGGPPELRLEFPTLREALRFKFRMYSYIYALDRTGTPENKAIATGIRNYVFGVEDSAGNRKVDRNTPGPGFFVAAIRDIDDKSLALMDQLEQQVKAAQLPFENTAKQSGQAATDLGRQVLDKYFEDDPAYLARRDAEK